MKFLQSIKSIALLMLLMGFFFSATVTSCGNKKTDDTEQAADHPEAEGEHPEGDAEHPEGGDEHPE
ncbi:hypothetical protein [Cyclobacterium roseum]|uniref:hypothetical protein n=1 Tax=Cyclobacterium roseum TaxID=2666137 RepID=UPI001390E958|nr:hypothetical protein [Cyclobacterium roseum]